MIKKSIVFKIFISMVIIQIVSMFIINMIIYSEQNNTVSHIIEMKKLYANTKIEQQKEYAINKEMEILNIISSSVSGAISEAMYNIDNRSAELIIEKLFQRNNIKAVYCFDTAANNLFLIAYKNESGIVFTDKLPKKLIKLKYIKTNLMVDSQDIGFFKIYYDNSKILDHLNKIEKEDLLILKNENLIIENDVEKSLYHDVISFIIGAFFIIFTIVILLNKLVRQPLFEFQSGLKSFFDYLADPSKKVQKIDINTEDEFGQMTKSVNESIEVSMQMHGEMAQLMRAVDKNVITSETDEKGIITYVSQAFCDISGYCKDELLGKPHNIVRHPDMSKYIFKELWETLNSNQTWVGEVKNLRKDGTYYWVHTIISPKCVKSNVNCGYTAIRYDITNKKEVEDLTANLEIKIKQRTSDLEDAKKEVEIVHKQTRDSIKYASLIQGALIPLQGVMTPYFKDHFVTWIPKDTVGGDIWLFNELRHKDECLLYFIDCTGHGVPGAFVTMIVKAVEREVTAMIKSNPNKNISPAWIMGYFNKTIKKLLRQETKDSLSNAGWDGGIIYYNRRDQVLKFAGAETSLFYMTTDGEYKTIKGNRYSVGYKKCDSNYEYKETVIDVQEGMKFYCTTDGYLDQNGGEKDFPFGKKRFSNIIKENYTKPMKELQIILNNKMKEYESMILNNDRNDDMTVIAFEIGKKLEFIDKSLLEIIKYEGVITQNVISTCMDNIESKIKNIGMVGIISTITIEYCQNMMNYSKGLREDDIDKIIPSGTIEVQLIENLYYDIIATNIISAKDKEKIEPKLIEIKLLEKSEIKKRYRELRRSGQNTHEKGGGIGLYEIAKVSDSIEYSFKAINQDKYIFMMKSIVKIKKDRV